MLLAHEAAHGVARVGETDAGELLLEEALPEDHLATHTAREGRRQALLDVLERERVVGDHLADETVAPGDRVDQVALLVLHFQADAVVLLLDEVERPRLLGPGVQALLGNLVERAHGNPVPLLRQTGRRRIDRRSDLREHRAVRGELLELLDERIELGVGDLRLAVVVEVAVTADLLLQMGAVLFPAGVHDGLRRPRPDVREARRARAPGGRCESPGDSGDFDDLGRLFRCCTISPRRLRLRRMNAGWNVTNTSIPANSSLRWKRPARFFMG